MQFVYPGFMWGLFAIAIPIAIHLLQLRRPQRVLFTNTSFIREVELTTMRRRRLQELVVLALRMLAIAALVLLFAQPYWTPRQVARPGGEVAVLVDTSPSMQALGPDGHLLLRAAIDQGQLLGKSYGLTTRFHVVGQGNEPLTQVAYISKLTTLPDAGKLVGWDAAASRQEMQRKQAGPLYVFSDFQRSEQRPAFLQKIPTDREVVLVPLPAPAAANVYADSVWLDDAFIRPQTNLALHIRLRNGGSKDITDCPVKVKLGERQVAAFRTTLAAGQVATTIIQVQVPDGQLAKGEVLTEDAPVTFDNAFYFTLQPTATIRVVEIGEEPVARQAYQAEPLFAYSFVKAGQVDYGELRQANLVLVQGVAVDAGLRQALVGVVQRGGSVVVVPPASSAAQESTSQLLRALGAGGAQWEPTASVPARQEVAMPVARDPFFRDVFGAQPRQVTMPQVSPVLRLPGSGRAILKLRDGDGYLMEYRGQGAGRTYVFTAPFARAYGDFTAQALFVPVLYRMALLSYHTDQLPAYRLADPALALTVPPMPAGTSGEAAQFQLVRDSLTLIPAQRLRGTTLQLELPPTMSAPGFYELRQRGKLLTTLAFNASRQESELAAYSAAELRQLVGPGHPNVQVLEGGGATALASYRAGQTGQPLWRYCLLAALACLLAEALVLRFGRARVGRQAVAVA